jgi:hypothetical protein
MGLLIRIGWNFLCSLAAFALLTSSNSTLKAQPIPFVPLEGTWTYFEGTSEASHPDRSSWRQAEFDDTQWMNGQGPFHTETFTGMTPVDFSISTSLFLRQSFQVDDPNLYAELTLSARSDDGFIAWINGHEVVRYNMPPGDLRFNSRATRGARAPIQFIDQPIPNARSLLTPGVNTLAIHAFNATSPSTRADFLLEATLQGKLDIESPTIETRIPEANRTIVQFETVEIFFSEPVTDVDASDLRVNGEIATDLLQLNGHQYLFSYPSQGEGEIIIDWDLEHGITDLAGNLFLPSPWQYNLNPGIALSEVQITEFMASNDSTINDENGDRSDWIELHNASEADILLKDWALTDTLTEPRKWLFPNIILSAGDYLLVYASGKNRSERFGQLHTNFKLSASGEYLALTPPTGQPTSEYTPSFPSQFADTSYGTIPGTENTDGYFARATPRKPNQTGGSGFAPEVMYSKTSGTFAENFQLVLESSQTGTTIKYTLDGELPNQNSPTYRRPIPINDSTEVRTRTFHSDLLPGPPTSETYIKLDPAITALRSTLPLMVISRLGTQRISGSRNTPVHFSVFEPKGGKAYLLSDPDFAQRGAAKTRGSSTGSLAKSSWAIEWRDEFGEDENHSILGMPSESEWVLYAPNNFDPIMIHNPFLHQLSRDVGDYSPRTRFVEVYLNEGGPLDASQYEGIYVLEEKISIGKNRVNIDKLRPENVTLPEVSGGYLLKIDRPDPGDSGITAMGTRVLWVDPKEDDIDTPRGSPNHPQEEFITNYLNLFHQASNSEQWRDPEIGYHAYIETDQWINFHILEVLSGNVDSLVLSTYLHKPRNGKLVFGPHWDFDRALGSTDGRDANPASWTNGPFFNAPPFGRLVKDPDFWQRWVDRWQELREDQLSITHINGIIDQQTDQIRPAVPREIQRWRTRMRGGTYDTEIAHMKNWLRRKIEFIDGQMAQPPLFQRDSGVVEEASQIQITATDGAQIYYTTDGTDPRLFDGVISPSALRYRRPITVSETMTIIARVRQETKRQTSVSRTASTPWSGPIKRVYTTELPSLVISEIMFHPSTQNLGPNEKESDLEYIELLNTGDAVANLEGLRFVSGIDFVFDGNSSVLQLGPGERLVIAGNLERLKEEHPNLGAIVGNFQGSLSNNQNRLRMINKVGLVILDVTYRDDWLPLADGTGFSIALEDEILSQNELVDPNAWRLSSFSGGSPAESEPKSPPLPGIQINEIQAYRADQAPDRVELFNTSDTSVDLTGWYLTDNLATPRKHQLRPGTVIPALSYLTIAPASLSGNDSLRLNRLGDTVHLLASAADGRLAGWVDGVIFRGSRLDQSYVRHIDSFGKEHFSPSSSNTFGEANSPPQLSPIIVRTINYTARNRDGSNNSSFEFIELLNSSATPVSLFLENAPTTTWRLRGAVDYNFPANMTLAPLESVTIVGFDPQTDTTRFSDFRSAYSIPPTATVLGPWSGVLDNAGDRIELLAPAPGMNESDQIAYVPAEVVSYQPIAPWPTIPEGSSEVLSRIDFSGYSGDPAHWVNAFPTVGDRDDDQDGLPDLWEQQFGLDSNSSEQQQGPNGDPDQDGLTNREELLAGTNPINGASTLSIGIQLEAYPLRFSARAKPILLSFPSIPGRRYSIYGTTSLSDPEWTLVSEILGSEDSSTTEINEGITVRGRDIRFYRVETP